MAFKNLLPVFFLVFLLGGYPSVYGTPEPGGPEGEVNNSLVLKTVINGNITPKSIGHDQRGRFFAQNMVYRHSITVYDRNYNLLKTLNDRFNFSQFGISGYRGTHRGAPVEISFAPDGQTAWVSNYAIEGAGFDHPGNDNCESNQFYDNSYLFRVDLRSLEIVDLVEVGAVPKYLKVTPDNRRVLVSNWCSGDVSVVDPDLNIEVGRIAVGNYPRGLAVDSKSRYAYVAVMGDDRIGIVRLSDYSVNYLDNVGLRPRHVCLGPADRYLYVSLSREGTVSKIDLLDGKTVRKVRTGREVRSMTLSRDGKSLYVTNYAENTLVKLRTSDMSVIGRVKTEPKPVGVTFDDETGQVWVACYSGSIMVFEDLDYRVASNYQGPLSADPEPTPTSTRQTTSSSPAQYLPIIRETRKAQSSILDFNPRQNQQSAQVTPQNTAVSSSQQDEFGFPDDNQAQASTFSPEPVLNDLPPRQETRSITRFHVIVGSFPDRSNAQNFAEMLKSQGFTPEILRVGENRFRVSSNQLTSREAATRAALNVRELLRVDAWVWQE